MKREKKKKKKKKKVDSVCVFSLLCALPTLYEAQRGAVGSSSSLLLCIKFMNI